MASLVGEEGRVFAFEPLPTSHEMILRNVHENGFETQVQVFRLAASDRQASLEGSIVANMCVLGYAGEGERFDIQTARVDDLLEGPIHLVKMDVEGHELAATRGMRRLLEHYKPLVLAEINEYWLQNCGHASGTELLQLLDSIGYDVFDVNDLNRPVKAKDLDLGPLGLFDTLSVPKGPRGLDLLETARIP